MNKAKGQSAPRASAADFGIHKFIRTEKTVIAQMGGYGLFLSENGKERKP